MSARVTVRIFPDDETTAVIYEGVTHVFWEAGNTVLTICLPDQDRHAHWLRERIRHYDVLPWINPDEPDMNALFTAPWFPPSTPVVPPSPEANQVNPFATPLCPGYGAP